MASSSDQPTLRRSLGIFDGIAILIGITIGAGIYSTPQIIAGYQSSFWQIIAFWIISGVFVYIGGLIYAELGTRLPNTGGEYVYLNRAFGPYVGFIFGWSQLFIIRTSPAAGLAIITANYLEYFLPLSEMQHSLVAITIIGLVAWMNYIGIDRASVYQKFSTIVKTGGLFMLVVLGIVLLGGRENQLAEVVPPTTDLGWFGNLSATMMLVVFSFLGWDRVGYAAGEMRNPRRVVPLSMFYGIGCIVLIYVLTNTIYHYALGMEGVRASKIVASDVAILLFGPVGAGLVAIVVMISATGSINGTMMTAPRVYFAMARDGLFFRWLNFVHPRYRTPSRAVIVHALWAVVILLVRSNFENIVAGMTFAVLIFYAFTTLALFKLRRENIGECVEDEDSGDSVTCYRMPLYPLLPAIYFSGIVGLIIIRAIFEWEKSLIDLAFIATGIPFALWWCRGSQSKVKSEK